MLNSVARGFACTVVVRDACTSRLTSTVKVLVPGHATYKIKATTERKADCANKSAYHVTGHSGTTHCIAALHGTVMHGSLCDSRGSFCFAEVWVLVIHLLHADMLYNVAQRSHANAVTSWRSMSFHNMSPMLPSHLSASFITNVPDSHKGHYDDGRDSCDSSTIS